LNPTESPSTPVPSSQAPTYEACNTIICPEARRGSKEAINAGCNAWHAGYGIITDGFWSLSPSNKIDTRDGPYLPNPNWPGYYPPSIFCQWTIYGSVLPQGGDVTRTENSIAGDTSRNENIPRPITLSFGQASLERGYDWVKVYDANMWSNTAQRGPTVNTYIGWQGELKSLKNVTCDVNINDFNPSSGDSCFRYPLAPVTARDGVMYITFQSDASLQMRGFNFTFQVQGAPEPPTATTLRNPGSVYVYGALNSNICPAGSNPVTTAQECNLAATVLTRGFVSVRSANLPVNCSTTTRQVIFNSHPTGAASANNQPVCFTPNSGATIFASSSSAVTPPTLQPTPASVASCKGKGTQTIQFVTDTGKVPTGQFSAGLPYEDSATCEWIIFKQLPATLPVNGNLVSTDTDVTLTFQSFDTETGFDELVIFNGDTGAIVAKLSGTKTKLPGPYTIPGGYARLRFTSDFSLSGAGFLATYTFSAKSQAASGFKGATVDDSAGSAATLGDSRIVTVMAVGVVAAVLLGIVGVVIYRSKRAPASRPKISVELPATNVQPEVEEAKARNVW
jgi:hypothetical protein